MPKERSRRRYADPNSGVGDVPHGVVDTRPESHAKCLNSNGLSRQWVLSQRPSVGDLPKIVAPSAICRRPPLRWRCADPHQSVDRLSAICRYCTNVKSTDALLPIRHPQRDLFICDVADAVLKDDMASMEHPFFALTTQKDTRVRRYQNGENWVEVVPSVKGLATVFDKDILIFATSQLMAARNEGRPISQEIVITARDLLVFTNRYTGGHNYDLLEDALERLSGTRVRTNVKAGGSKTETMFGLVDAAEVVRDDSTGRVTKLYIKLSDFLFRAIQSQEVLSLAPDYFRLRKAIERRLYEIARKHCGAQTDWSIGLQLLQNKVGSSDTLRAFRQSIRQLSTNDHLPDYGVELDDDDRVKFTNRRLAKKIVAATDKIHLSGDAYHDARQLAPGWDVYVLEQKWRAWLTERMDEGLEGPRDANAAFCGFCRKWFERNGVPR
jgi:hypothetical protein